MGSLRSKPEGSLECQYITTLEASIGFDRNSPEEVQSVFSRFITNGTLDRRAVALIGRYLGLRNTALLNEIANTISHNEERILVEHLLVLAILLSSGSSLQKAELLWDLYDREASGEMQRDALQNLFEGIVTAACSIVVKIAKPPADISEARFNKWQEDVKVRVVKGKEGFVDHFIGDKLVLKREDFFQKAVKTDFTFSTPSIRAKVEKLPHVAFNPINSFARFKKPAA